MAEQIYNEGRVVGISAYETFVRICLQQGIQEPDIPDEKRWLTSMIGMGSSLVLQITPDIVVEDGIIDIPLPANSSLLAAGTILANPFLGECGWDSSTSDDGYYWADKVTSYSPLIENTSSSNPPTSNGGVPAGTYNLADYTDQLNEFMKIKDGIVFTQDAIWYDTSSQSPYKDINPNFRSSSAIIRLYVTGTIQHAFYILFTGFHNKGILYLSDYATVENGGSADPTVNNWKDGGMLGPEKYPWASKIVFSVPSSVYGMSDTITRTIPATAEYIPAEGLDIDGITFSGNAIGGKVNSNAFIDFSTINLSDYYSIHRDELIGNNILEDVTAISLRDASNDCSEIVAWYPGMNNARLSMEAGAATPSNADFFPPAIYGTHITSTGQAELIPLDTAAPGTVKCFTDPDIASRYTQILPDSYSVYFNTTTNNFSFVIPSEPNYRNWPGSAKVEYLDVDYPDYPLVKVTAGQRSASMVAVTDSVSGLIYNMDGTGGTTDKSPAGMFCWDDLLKSLKGNKSIDLFGTKLKNFAIELNTYNYVGMNNVIENLGANWIMLNPGLSTSNPRHVKEDSVWVGSEVNAAGERYLTVNSGETLASIHLGTTYIKFKSSEINKPDLKLYICGTEPNPVIEDIPVGSIGIGW